MKNQSPKKMFMWNNISIWIKHSLSSTLRDKLDTKTHLVTEQGSSNPCQTQISAILFYRSTVTLSYWSLIESFNVSVPNRGEIVTITPKFFHLSHTSIWSVYCCCCCIWCLTRFGTLWCCEAWTNWVSLEKAIACVELDRLFGMDVFHQIESLSGFRDHIYMTTSNFSKIKN